MRQYLDVAPPIGPKRSRAFGEVDLLRRVRGVEGILVVDRPAVAMERNTRERARRVFHLHTSTEYPSHRTIPSGDAHQLDGIPSRIAPVVVVSDDLRAREAVAVHEAAEGEADRPLLRRGDLARWVRRVGVLRLVLRTRNLSNIANMQLGDISRTHLDADSVYRDALALKSLERLEEVVGV